MEEVGLEERLKFFDQYSRLCESIESSEKLLSAAERDDLFPKTTLGFYFENINEEYKKSIGEYFQYTTTTIADMMRCSSDLKFSISNLYLFKPFVTNPVTQAVRASNGDYICRNFPNWETYRYDFFLSICEEKIYNFWDRIGDLIYFTLQLNDRLEYRKLYFGTVIDLLAKSPIYQNIEQFKWLLDFKNNEFKEINDSRKTVVHYHQKSTEYHVKWINNVSDLDYQQKLHEERIGKADYYKKYLDLGSIGFQQTCLFLKEATTKLYEDSHTKANSKTL